MVPRPLSLSITDPGSPLEGSGAWPSVGRKGCWEWTPLPRGTRSPANERPGLGGRTRASSPGFERPALPRVPCWPEPKPAIWCSRSHCCPFPEPSRGPCSWCLDPTPDRLAQGCFSWGSAAGPAGSASGRCPWTPNLGPPEISLQALPHPPGPLDPRSSGWGDQQGPQGWPSDPPPTLFPKGIKEIRPAGGGGRLSVPTGGKLNNVPFCGCELEPAGGPGAGGCGDWQLVASPKSKQPMKFLIAGVRLAWANK